MAFLNPLGPANFTAPNGEVLRCTFSHLEGAKFTINPKRRDRAQVFALLLKDGSMIDGKGKWQPSAGALKEMRKVIPR